MENSDRENVGGTEAQGIGAEADRRKFLSTLGRFSVVTPPAITLLLSTSLSSQAIAHSGGRGDWGGGHGHDRDHDHDRGFGR